MPRIDDQRTHDADGRTMVTRLEMLGRRHGATSRLNAFWEDQKPFILVGFIVALLTWFILHIKSNHNYTPQHELVASALAAARSTSP